MATFPAYEPLYGASKSSAPRVNTFRAGDGYEQRVVFGIQNDPKEWSLEWNLSEDQAAEVETFLEDQAGATAFDWTPPDSNTSAKWVCSEWNKSIEQPFRAIIRATFRQVFEQ